MKRETNILIAGQIRDVNLLNRTLDQLCALRNEHEINRIIISTWKNEIQKFERLRESLLEKHIEVIESHEPNHFTIKGNYFHQMTTLYQGLKMLPSDSIIFKTRSDVIFRDKTTIMEILGKDLISSHSPKHKILAGKIWSPFFEISQPFFICDQIYLGLQRDLMRFTKFDASREVLYNELPQRSDGFADPETRRFLQPFMDEYPIFYRYFEYMQYISQYNREVFVRLFDYNMRNTFYWKTISLYYYILNEYFLIGGDNLRHKIALVRHTLDNDNPFNKFDGWYITPHGATDINHFSGNFDVKRTTQLNFLFCDSDIWLKNIFSCKIQDNFLSHEFFRLLHQAMSYSNIDAERLESDMYIDGLKQLLAQSTKGVQ